MSEEEIIKKLTEPKKYDLYYIIREFKRNGIDNYVITKPELIQGLLDLYNKEKEKNKNIEDIFVVDNLPKDQVAIIISKEYFSEYTELKSNYISKDKIKEKIEEYKNMRDKKFDYMSIMYNKLDLVVQVLQELLEERN